jgi:hypothetical protein
LQSGGERDDDETPSPGEKTTTSFLQKKKPEIKIIVVL